MIIAVTYQNGEIFQHFGHTEQFKLYEVENGKVVKSDIMNSNGSGHGALAGLLKAETRRERGSHLHPVAGKSRFFYKKEIYFMTVS